MKQEPIERPFWELPPWPGRLALGVLLGWGVYSLAVGVWFTWFV